MKPTLHDEMNDKILRYFVLMSHTLSHARITFEQGVSCISDVILREMGDRVGPGNLASARTFLEQSDNNLRRMARVTALLRECVHTHGLNGIDRPEAVATDLSCFGLGRMHHLHAMADHLTHGTFLDVLYDIEGRIQNLRFQTGSLARKLAPLTYCEQWGTLTRALSSLYHGNPMRDIAEIYGAWSEFQGVFHAATLLSNDFWHRLTKFPAVAPAAQDRPVIAVTAGTAGTAAVA